MTKAELCSGNGLLVDIHGVELELLADRAVYCPAQGTLFIADTHFGKEATFQRQGVAVPRACMTETLSTIDHLVKSTRAETVVVLGDLFHARCSFVSEVRDEFSQFLERHSQLRWLLVEGNHDRQAGRLPTDWNIELVKPGYRLHNLELHHHPIETLVSGPIGRETETSPRLQLCGHLHPAVVVGSKRERVGRLPCFWLRELVDSAGATFRQLVLPAMGTFTGHLTIRPESCDGVWVIADTHVMKLC